MPNTQLILLHTEHPLFGALLIPYIAQKTSDDGQLSLVEQAFHASAKSVAQMSEAERRAIDIASHYTEKYLMQVYSNEKTVARFLQKLAADPERIKESIRPYIEKKLLEMIELITVSGLPLYQKQGSSKVLFPHHQYHIHREAVHTAFLFEVDDQQFSYQLNCTVERQDLELSSLKPTVVLTSQPATLLLGMNLFVFRHIESTRVMPFTRKNRISVPVTFLPKYIENIVKPIARYHEVATNGLDMQEEAIPCKPFLSIEETLHGELELSVCFQYGDNEFTPADSPEIKHFLPRKETDSETTVRYFCRDRDKEAESIGLLLGSGMTRVDESHYKLADDTTEKSINDWMIRHREMLLQHFQLSDLLSKREYCLDEIHIEQHYGDGLDWFDLHITVVVGAFRIPFGQFRKHILEERREFILPDDRILLLPEEWFSKYANLMELGQSNEESIRLQRSFIGAIEGILENTAKGSRPAIFSASTEPPTPSGLKATLRPYQQKGYAWMHRLNELGFGGCLADDMGLGKTLQTLTLLQYVYRGAAGNSTANEPEETIQAGDGNYTSSNTRIDGMGQFTLFDDDLLYNAASGTIQSAKTNDKEPIIRKPSTLIVMPTSLLHNWRKEARRFTTLSMVEYNTQSRIRQDRPEWFFDQCNLVFTSYGMLRNNIDLLSRYCFEYVVLDESQHIKNSDSITFQCATRLQCRHRLVLTGTPIENSLKDLWAQFHFLQPGLLGSESEFGKRFVQPIRLNDTRKETRLRQLIAPFILRRSKREVAPELPPLTEEIIYCDMSDEQDALYRQEKNSLRNTLLQTRAPGERHQALTVLNGITRLRQLACHPQMIFPDSIADSGKLELIIDTFETLRSAGHKVLIFSSFVKHLELIAAAFRQRQWPYALLTGASTDRPEEIARFTQSDEIQAFLISLKAGGVGLNLTQADYVFIIDPWWNPAAEAQAISRAHRIGQDKQVIAYRFITQGSIEEKIILLQESKRKLAGTLITDSDSLPPLSDKEWMDLLS